MKRLAASALALAIIFTSIYSVSTNPGMYYKRQTQLDVETASGFAEYELMRLDSAVAGYLAGRNELDEADFSEREIIHMRDVRRLVEICFYLMLTAWAAFAVFLTLLVRRYRSAFAKRLGEGGIFAGIALAIIMLAALAASLIDFGGAFTWFHKLLFTNDYWLLPADSTLIRMFPEAFFQMLAFDAWLRILSLAAIVGVIIAAIGKAVDK